jgi:hypothetical protein
MTRDRRTSDCSLITGRRNNNNAAPGSVIQSLDQLALASSGYLFQGCAQIQDVSAGINAIDNCNRKLLRSCAGHVLVRGNGLGKNRPD